MICLELIASHINLYGKLESGKTFFTRMLRDSFYGIVLEFTV